MPRAVMHSRATITSTAPCHRVLEPLDFGTTHGKLVEELLSFWTTNALREIGHLQHPTHHWRQGGERSDTNTTTVFIQAIYCK
jgi:hypothetical protein